VVNIFLPPSQYHSYEHVHACTMHYLLSSLPLSVPLSTHYLPLARALVSFTSLSLSHTHTYARYNCISSDVQYFLIQYAQLQYFHCYVYLSVPYSRAAAIVPYHTIPYHTIPYHTIPFIVLDMYMYMYGYGYGVGVLISGM
jgi:hypothetical protein